MKIFLSSSIFPNRKIISDENKNFKIDLTEPIQLLFTDGNHTINVFKELYLADVDAYFVVKNIEFFMFKMRLFKNLDFEVIENNDKTMKYANIFNEKEGISKKMSKMVEKYILFERNFIKNNEDIKNKGNKEDKTNTENKGNKEDKTNTENKGNKEDKIINQKIKEGVLISFKPKIFDSIRTSLENSKVYLSNDQNCHLIYKKLKENKCKIEEIEKLSDDKESIYKTLKSMIFSGVVIKKGENFSLNEILQ